MSLHRFDCKSEAQEFSPKDQVLKIPLPIMDITLRPGDLYSLVEVLDLNKLIMTYDNKKSKTVCHFSLMKSYNVISVSGAQAPSACIQVVVLNLLGLLRSWTQGQRASNFGGNIFLGVSFQKSVSTTRSNVSRRPVWYSDGR